MGQLSEYITAVQGKPFEWGKHDCLTFANEVARRCGRVFADDFLHGYDSARSAAKAYAKAKRGRYANIIEMVNDRLDAFTGLFPPNGSVVARESLGPLGYVFGVAWNGGALFVGDNGLELRPLAISDRFWT